MSEPDALTVLKQVAIQAVNAGYPCNWILGTVLTTNPLSIQIEQQEILQEGFLWLTDAVRDYEVDIEVNHVTENRAGGSGDPAFASHNHDYQGRKKIIVYNGLHVGEQVYMLQKQGGQSFVILGRVTQHTNLSGQWL